MTRDHGMPLLTGMYVPGNRPDRFEKAVRSGAELVVFDLEDAVAPDDKTRARATVVEWLTQHPVEELIVQVRINTGSIDDVDAIGALPLTVEIRLPKVEHAGDVDLVTAHAPGRPVTALIESASGLFAAASIAAHPSVTRLALGEADLRSELGGGMPLIDAARTQLAFAAAAAGLVAPMLSAYPAIDDVDGLIEDTRRGAEYGFVGRMAVHPRQLAPIAEAFRPSEREIAWARSVLEATERGGVSRLANGDMVDRAMRGRAERILLLVR